MLGTVNQAAPQGSVTAPPTSPPRRAPDAVAVRRRLIFVNRFFFPDESATSQMLTDLARGLHASDFELHVVCSRQLYGDPSAQLRRRERVESAQVHRVWSTRFGRDRLPGRALDYVTYFCSAGTTLLRLVRRGDIIVAMTDPPMISICAAAVAHARGAILINWLQDLFPEVAISLAILRVPTPLTEALRRARNWSLKVAQRNVVLSFRMQRTVTRLGVPESKQVVIENWADGVALTPRPTRWSALRRGVAAESDFVMQYSGNMGRAHDIHTILAAAAELRYERGWLFLFVGGGANMARLRAEAQRLRLEHLRFLPYQSRETLADSLAAGDVHLSCLQPAMEGLIVPSKFYGALAAGRPVIVIGDLDGDQARVVRAEDCGAVVRAGDGRALVDALRRMRSDPEWLHAAGQRARALFERHYALEHGHSRWQKLLQDVVAPTR